MYNRYIPQPDGSYHRRQMHDRPSNAAPPTERKTPDPPLAAQDCCPPQRSDPPQSSSIPSFLRQLLPRGLETADLLILVLLLLMAGDCEKDRNNALLTMALYFIL